MRSPAPTALPLVPALTGHASGGGSVQTMVSGDQLTAFAVAAFVLIVIPGPSVLFVVGRALAHGRRTALASVAGGAVGLYIVAACVALGLGALVERSAAVYTGIKLVGAAYLVWLGIQTIRHRRERATSAAGAAPPGSWRAARDGFVVSVTNPKAFIIFAAVLPQFVDRSAGHVPVQMLLLGLVAIAIALVSDSAWAITAGTVRSWFARSPRRAELVGGVGGLSMVGLGVSVAVSGRRD